MIFLTVGTQFPFDRLTKFIDDIAGQGHIEEEIFAQIGDSSYVPVNFKAVASLKKQEFDGFFSQASAVIGHAGMGTIAMALEQNKPLLAMPRLKKHGEVVNDHQVAIASKFAELGYILAAHHKKDLLESLEHLKTFTPKKRLSGARDVARRISGFLSCCKV
ncbi:MAG: glycosyltransferase [Planctomycetota bacterium]|jgi:UDP-N-acetylglucosamine transferase subunit ALG13